MSALEIRLLLKNSGDAQKAITLQKFFKTGKGEYAEGDIFLGVTVPKIRKIAKHYSAISLNEIQNLLASKIHEERAASLFICVYKYQKSSIQAQEEIVSFYLQNMRYINNWDLVDLSCYFILGHFYHAKKDDLFLKLAESDNLWERRIAIVSCLYSIRKHNYFDTALIISHKLLKDKHHLIHKAVGWVLREIGKKDKEKLLLFLNNHAHIMPRIMLRYSIERLNQKEREHYMQTKTDFAPIYRA